MKDFTEDTPHYWEDFDKNGIMGERLDPDIYSPSMRLAHQKMWSKQLPNGEKIQLELGADKNSYYLVWKDFRFGADSIVNMYFHHKGAQVYLTEEVKRALMQEAKNGGDFVLFVKEYLHQTYTIGGNIIFPKNGYNSINPRRYGVLKDRFDLALECIRRYYAKEESPMTVVLEANEAFFELFQSFKGYVDFFYLQDMVTEDYGAVKYFIENSDLYHVSYPQGEKEWKELYVNQLDFVLKRNDRISKG